jgi:phage-related protein
MGYDIGPQIGIEGEKAFKNAIKDIDQQFKVLGSELKLVASEFDASDKSMEAVTARSGVLNKEIEVQKSKVAELGKALANASESFGENDKRTQEWAVKLNNAKAELNGLEKALADNESSLDKAGNEAKEFDEQLKKTADTAEDSSGKFGKLGDILGGIGKALGAGVAAIGTAAAGAATALSGMSVSAAGYADDMLTLSTQTGISTDDLQKFKYASGLVDVELETLTKSMAKQIKSMSAAQAGSEAFTDAYKELGVSVTNSDGTLRNSQDVYWEVIDALGKISNETERDALGMQLLGKSAQELNPLIQAGSDRLKELGDQAVAAGAVMSGETLDAFGAFDDQLQFLGGGVEAAKNALGGVLLPQLTELSSVGVGLLGEFTSGLNSANGDMSKIGDVVSGVLSSAISAITEILPEFIDYGLQIITSIVTAISDNIPTVIPVVIDIVMTIVDKIIELLPDLLQTGVDILLAVIDGITEALPKLIPAAIEAILTIVQGLIDNLPDILKAALDIILALAEGILAALPELIKALPAIITGIVDFIIGAIPDIIQAGITIFIALVEALPEIIETIVEAIPEIITGIIDALLENLPLIIDAGVQLFVALIENLPKIIETIITAIPEIVKAIVSAFASKWDDIKQAGTDLIKGIWQGISDAGQWLKEKISGFFGGVVDSIKDFFGISSPSKLFEEEIGLNLGYGIGAGFEKAMKTVSADMQNAIPTEFDIDTPDYNPARPGGTGIGAGRGTIHQTVNIYQPVKSPYEVARETRRAAEKVVYGV